MGTTHQSPFESGFALSRPEAKNSRRRAGRIRHRPNRNQQRSTKLSALEEVLQWRAAAPGESRKFLESFWKSAAGQVSGAAKDVQKRSTATGFADRRAEIFSDSLPAIKNGPGRIAGGNSRDARLPHVDFREWSSPVPRCFALAAVYLRFAGFEFEERKFARFVAAVQKSVLSKCRKYGI